jgi:dihydrofolate reductase
MAIRIIVAIASNRVIGAAGHLPWRLPDDMARFKALTMGHPVIMGRATFDSLGKPLSGRTNIVLTRTAGLAAPGCRVVGSRAEALEAAGSAETLFIIGGASVYQLFLPITDRLSVTWIDRDVEGDTLFPAVDWDAWRVLETSPAVMDSSGQFPHRFVEYGRKTP